MARDMDRWLGNGGMPILDLLGAALTAYGEGWVEGTWTPTAEACNPFGGVHAGTSAVLHDALMNFAVNAGLASGARTRATLDLQAAYVRGARAGDALALRGEVVRLTRQVAHAEATVRDGGGDLVSRATGTFLLERPDAGPGA
jgi:uncharacterized protein (TIGR00369 family)